MQDVAREARCSSAAVSMALRGDRSIPPTTRARIEAAAARLGYRVNPLVSALMTLQRRRRPAADTGAVVGYLSSHHSDNPWRRHAAYRGMYAGVSERSRELGYRIEEFDLGADGMTPLRMRQILRTRNVHGLVVAPLPHQATRIDFDFADLAAVGLGLSVHAPVLERVANDHFQSAALAVERCFDLGYRRVGLALCRETSLRLDHRALAGFEFALGQLGAEVRLPPLQPLTDAELLAAVPAWLRTWKPEVVIFDNPYAESQAAIPAQVGFVSLAVERPNDTVSGIFQNYPLLGRVALEHVAAKLYTNSFGSLKEAHLHLVAGAWVQGNTAPGPRRRRRG